MTNLRLQPATRANLEAQIRMAYAALAPRPGAWVKLSDIFPVVDAMASDTTAALIEMHCDSVSNRSRSVILIPESNQKTLTEWDRLRAVTIGNEPRHLIAIHN